MKKLIILLSFLLLNATVPTEELTIQEIIEVRGLTKNQIFKKSQEWIAKLRLIEDSFYPPKYVDEKGGIITAYIDVFSLSIDDNHYSGLFTIECIDENARLTIIPLKTIGRDGIKYPIVDSDKHDAIKSCLSLMVYYSNFITTPTPPSPDQSCEDTIGCCFYNLQFLYISHIHLR